MPQAIRTRDFHLEIPDSFDRFEPQFLAMVESFDWYQQPAVNGGH